MNQSEGTITSEDYQTKDIFFEYENRNDDKFLLYIVDKRMTQLLIDDTFFGDLGLKFIKEKQKMIGKVKYFDYDGERISIIVRNESEVNVIIEDLKTFLSEMYPISVILMTTGETSSGDIKVNDVIVNLMSASLSGSLENNDFNNLNPELNILYNNKLLDRLQNIIKINNIKTGGVIDSLINLNFDYSTLLNKIRSENPTFNCVNRISNLFMKEIETFSGYHYPSVTIIVKNHRTPQINIEARKTLLEGLSTCLYLLKVYIDEDRERTIINESKSIKLQSTIVNYKRKKVNISFDEISRIISNENDLELIKNTLTTISKLNRSTLNRITPRISNETRVILLNEFEKDSS